MLINEVSPPGEPLDVSILIQPVSTTSHRSAKPRINNQHGSPKPRTSFVHPCVHLRVTFANLLSCIVPENQLDDNDLDDPIDMLSKKNSHLKPGPSSTTTQSVSLPVYLLVPLQRKSPWISVNSDSFTVTEPNHRLTNCRNPAPNSIEVSRFPFWIHELPS